MNSGYFGRAILLAGAAGGGLLAATAVAQAGGFINQSQSTVFNGLAYAGYGAPGFSPSGMFINPAIMTQFTRITTENNFSMVVPQTRITGASGVIPAIAGGTIRSGDIAQDVLVPASYLIVPLGSGFTVGASFNAPFGSITKPDIPWGGQLNSLTTKLRTYTLSPAIAYEVSPQLSIAVGAQIQYMKVSFGAAAGPGPTPPMAGLEGDGWGFGVTAGLTWKPFQGTAIGLGYRSQIDQKLEGNFVLPGLPAALNSAKTTVKLPDRVNLSLRQAITPQFDLLASIEWHNWSRIGTSRITGPGVTAGVVPAALRSIPLEYRDAWFFALGGEYRWNQFLTLRAGMAYEISPITTAVRTTRLPDNDRFWLSAGLSYEVSDRITINASYSHVFIKGANINIQPPFGVPYVGNAKASADIFSLGFTTRWGSPSPGVLTREVVRKG